MKARQAASGRRAHQTGRVEMWPWRTLFARRAWAETSSSGKATSIRRLRGAASVGGMNGSGARVDDNEGTLDAAFLQETSRGSGRGFGAANACKAPEAMALRAIGRKHCAPTPG